MISSYYYNGLAGDPWEFEETSLDNINLLVGTSGAGKTKFLNTIFNFSSFVSHGQPFREGLWKITVQANQKEYQWEFRGERNDHGQYEITYESLLWKELGSNSAFEPLIHRSKDVFTFLGAKLPKLETDKPSVTLLKEEETIKPFHQTFAKVQRRNFHDEALRDAISLEPILPQQMQELKVKGILALWQQEHALSAKMHLYKEYFPEAYRESVAAFTNVFPSITACDVHMARDIKMASGVVPVFVVKEKGVNRWIALHELSSGMQKVLLILTDIVSLPKDSIYIIDEYENSLGINAINFLPQFLVEHAEGTQFIITTHHPYLINSMPMNTWRVFHRVGSKVVIKHGGEFEKKYGKSKQQAFIQLINDPFYSGIV